MDDFSKKALGQLGNLGKGLGKAVTDETGKIAKATAQQIGIEKVEEEKGKQTEQGQTSQDTVNASTLRDKQTEDIVKSLYGASSDKKTSDKDQKKQEEYAKFAEGHKGRSPEKIQELYRDYQRTHKETYYDPLVSRAAVHDKSKIEEEQKKQESAEERIKRMQQEDLQKKKEEEEKKKPISPLLKPQTTKVESLRGVSG